MPSAAPPRRPLSTTLTLLALWIAFYASFTLFRPALLDDADSVHAEVAREMLLRHDYVTLYANGIRYLEKAPLLYWAMAASMRVSQLLGHPSARCLAVASRIPLALTVLALAFAVEAFARRAFTSTRAGLYAALILLSSPGIFLFTRLNLPDAMVCLWLTLAMVCFYLTEQPTPNTVILSGAKDPCISPPNREPRTSNLLCCTFAACCALNVLSKGLIGIVFPLAIVAIYLLLTRGLRGTGAPGERARWGGGALARIRQLHPLSSLAVFLVLALPWHILIALANPTQGHPGSLTFTLDTSPHWHVPLPTGGNVHGWLWFYFVNEQVLRYLNLRVPRDYDTVPLYLFYGLILIWLMPWSAFLVKALAAAWRRARQSVVFLSPKPHHPEQTVRHPEPMVRHPEQMVRHPERSAAESKDLHSLPLTTEARTILPTQPILPTEPASAAYLLLLLWAALPLLFFSFSTRQEYYVLPSLPALAILLAGWLAPTPQPDPARRASLRSTAVLLTLGALFAAAALYLILHTRTPPPKTDLADLLRQNPGDYALSMGHFLDLDTRALALFRLPLALAAAALFLGPLASYLLRKRARPHAANLALAASAFTFLLAAHLGLQTFAPVLTSAQLAEAIAPQVTPNSLIVIHQEYEYGSTLGFYLQRPTYDFAGLLARSRPAGAPLLPPTPAELAHVNLHPVAVNPIHILTTPTYRGTPDYGRSSNLWYGSFFPDAPPIFETAQSLAARWHGPQRIFLWQSLDDQPSPLPAALTPAYVLARSGGKEIVSNQPNR